MSALSKLKMPRPGQLLAMILIALALAVVDYLAPAPSVGPGGAVFIVTWALVAHKAFVMWLGATEGLVVDLIVSHYARPGRFKDLVDRTMFLHCMHRRALFMALFAFGMGLAL
jgi:hypothetical protein